ncbi:MAG: alanine dehydrogenase [Gammaproteobacteria bacterium]|jgi:alanine dehydrogenase|nr:alanine dehydrogenase [Gammaproteobacteria bacterium]MBT3988073.1 alanine dehydrogenase [Gammaproteobacteria bacterium]MBT4658801.1 alanine dehydrogenase [Gammaproteobacteria bacterium]MBT5174887.1 alanine dehydrogenase [Gammaproteobacteria bacterium]MBT5511152.1 alanine dehydrogenase [Gammaproteobacteria bacterium]
MYIGVPKEIKNHEYRVGLTPAGVRELINHGHTVLIQKDAGAAIGLSNELYTEAGAKIIDTAEEVFAGAEMIIKVKEPQPEECKMLKPHHTLFTYLHLAPDPTQTQLLVESGAICIAYETVTDAFGALPLLAPMSEVAGRMSIQEAAVCLEKSKGGSGILLGGVPGVEAANVVVIGGGVVGLHAARMAMGLGANVTILDRSLARLKQIDELFDGRLKTIFSTADSIEKQLRTADAVIGAVLVPGASAPKLVTRDMLKLMKKGSVLVDVAIDQGGCFETSKPTTHQDPIFEVDGIIHYCVANMPGGVARTSTFALTNATLPYILNLADNGAHQALTADEHFLKGLNVCSGMITVQAVADALGYKSVEPTSALAQRELKATA